LIKFYKSLVANGHWPSFIAGPLMATGADGRDVAGESLQGTPTESSACQSAIIACHADLLIKVSMCVCSHDYQELEPTNKPAATLLGEPLEDTMISQLVPSF
jgi:hypothetical protein